MGYDSGNSGPATIYIDTFGWLAGWPRSVGDKNGFKMGFLLFFGMFL